MIRWIDDIEFTKEQEEILKKYLKEDWFKELNSYVTMVDEDAPIEIQIEHLKKYILHYGSERGDNPIETVQNFIQLLESYRKKEYVEPIRDSNGLIKLYKSGFNSGNGFYIERKEEKQKKPARFKGNYLNGIFISTDGKVYIKKESMDSMGQMGDLKFREQSKYNGVVAHEVFNILGEESASYLPAVEKFPFYFVLSENFLKPNQELITLDDFYNQEDDKQPITHEDFLNLIETNLRIRYKNNMSEEEYNNMISKIKMQYIKQTLVKRIIGLKDENLGNLGIVLTSNSSNTGVPEINLSPAFDLDMSFNMATETRMFQAKTNNLKTDIKSYIEEFQDVPGFRGFVEKIITIIGNPIETANRILDNAYDTSKARYLKSNNSRTNYIMFLKEKFEEVITAYKEIYQRSDRKGEDENAKTILD